MKYLLPLFGLSAIGTFVAAAWFAMEEGQSNRTMSFGLAFILLLIAFGLARMFGGKSVG